MITGVFRVGGGLLDGGDQIEIVLRRRDRRHEDVEPAVPGLDAERGAHDAGCRLVRRAGGALGRDRGSRAHGSERRRARYR